MSHQPVFRWGIVITVVMSLLSACGAASPAPVIIVPTPTAPLIPTPIPRAVVPRGIVIPPTITPWPAATETLDPTLAVTTLTVEPSPTLPAPIDRPFLMRIDRISVIVGRGTLLQGRVANGTLQANGNVEILGPQNKVISSSVLAILISNTVRDQVTVGDYTGILVGGIATTDLSPGMLLAAAGEFESYEEALRHLQ